PAPTVLCIGYSVTSDAGTCVVRTCPVALWGPTSCRAGSQIKSPSLKLRITHHSTPTRGTVNMMIALVRQGVGPNEEHLLWLEMFTELPHESRQLLADLVPKPF